MGTRHISLTRRLLLTPRALRLLGLTAAVVIAVAALAGNVLAG
jgi:hypothetical protein